MSDYSALGTWLEPLIAALGPGQRARLAGEISRALKASQIRRVAANLNPDGSAYAPRLPQIRRRGARGAIKRGPMYRRLLRVLKSRSSADGAELTLGGFSGRIGSVAQYGLVDQVRPGGPSHRYAVREILGFSPDDITATEAAVVNHLLSAMP